MSPASSCVRLAGVAAVVAASLATVPGTSSAAPAFCSQKSSYSGTTITWVGGAKGARAHAWGDAQNWNPTTVPDKAQDSTGYQMQYVCIGGGAKVEIAAGDSYHVAGVDIGQNAQLVVDNGGGVAVGAASKSDLVPSYVEKTGDLELDAATLGGNGTMTVAGTLDWAAQTKGKHKLPAKQNGSGETIIAKSGNLLVDGGKFGAAELSGTRSIDNSGTLTLSRNGYILMALGTDITDERSSSLNLDGFGGIYPSQTAATVGATVHQLGSVTRDGHGDSVVGVNTIFGNKVTPVVTSGDVAFAAASVPTAKLKRGTSYGIGSCDGSPKVLCRATAATKALRQATTVRTSTAGPKTSKITVVLSKAVKLKGAKALGQSVDVTAPTEKTTHSTSLTFGLDSSLPGFTKGAHDVYRGKKKITVCAVHGLTAENTSCIHETKTVGGNVEISVITIQPNATWTVAR